ncbi:hypothetical protein ALC57_16995 [Trachymyrmex cornetzi]|uniref:Uncharacterized protein n=1 Tax=Trachymyrmex cornetzi TaxID=471704 RepID=A0A151IU01_9HYME|nr:hypothetical protein ALC57_16995 [Trachymyrmex cornetzi]
MSDDYKYRLVEFKNTKNNVESVDIVPKEWIVWDKKKKELLCYFMPPYNREKIKELQNIIKSRQQPDYSWPKYNIQSCGKAKTYIDAEEKLKRLNVQKYAFTTDSELDAETKSKNDLEEFKMRENANKKELSSQEILDSAKINLKKIYCDGSFRT